MTVELTVEAISKLVDVMSKMNDKIEDLESKIADLEEENSIINEQLDMLSTDMQLENYGSVFAAICPYCNEEIEIDLEKLEEGINFCKKKGYPVMVKPYKLGSSIGVKKAENIEELKSAFFNCLRYGDKVIVEECLTNFIEINCACYKDRYGKLRASECERPIGKEEILSFSDKYEGGDREFPANIPYEISKEIKETTKKVYSALSMTGTVRIDYFYADGKVYLNEINTVPGSLSYYLFSETLKGFSDILSEQILASESNFARENSTVKNFPSTILKSCGIKSAKRL